MKILGLDLGTVTLGIAESDKSEILATAREIFRFNNEDYDKPLEYTLNLLKELKSDTCVLGLPKNMNNTLGPRAEASLAFKERLEQNGIKVILWDERLSTVEVTRVMIGANLSRKKRKDHVDALAATVILQGYLDSKRR